MTKLLRSYRAKESEQDLAAIVDDPIVVRFLATWVRTPVEWRTPKRKRPATADELWWWLWSGVRWDLEQVARAARISQSAAQSFGIACATARIIYPDGTCSKHALALLDSYTAHRFPGRRAGRPKGAKDGKKRPPRAKKGDKQS